MALYKQGEEGDFVFNDYQLGRISSVDFINPLKVVVFYEDVNTVVLLDNHLNEVERINFNSIPEFINASTATNAGNNQLWIFNIDSQQLELYNYRSQRKTLVSQPFEGKLLSQVSNFNECFLLTENKIRVFNIYGSLISEKDSEGYLKIVRQNKNLISFNGIELFLFTENSVNPIKIPLPEINVKDLQLTQDFLYIYDGKFLQTFTLTLPK